MMSLYFEHDVYIQHDICIFSMTSHYFQLASFPGSPPAWWWWTALQ